jgi:hypothetical protein
VERARPHAIRAAIASAHPAMLDLGYSVDGPTARARWSAIAEAT